MLSDYYELRGWDANGIPSDEKLRKLGLRDVAFHLKNLCEKEGH